MGVKGRVLELFMSMYSNDKLRQNKKVLRPFGPGKPLGKRISLVRGKYKCY